MPYKTGRLQRIVQVVRVGDEYVVWGSVNVPYALPQEVGRRGQPGRYFLRAG